MLHNLIGALWLFGTHAFLVLALCSALTRRAGMWLAFSVLSLLALPVSYAATTLFASGGFNRLF